MYGYSGRCKILVMRKESKPLKFYVNDAVYDQFKAKLDLDNITQKDLLQTAIYSYLYGYYSLEKNGRKITCSIDIE